MRAHRDEQNRPAPNDPSWIAEHVSQRFIYMAAEGDGPGDGLVVVVVVVVAEERGMGD